MKTRTWADPLEHPVIGAAFDRLLPTRLAEDIGLFALEERCCAEFRPGMTTDALISAVRAA